MSKKHIRKKQKGKEKIVAKEHIEELFLIAKKDYDKPIAKNSVKLAINYSTKYKVPIPKELKRSFCKECLIILKPGINCTVRLKPGKNPQQIITCSNCKKIKRLGYTKK